MMKSAFLKAVPFAGALAMVVAFAACEGDMPELNEGLKPVVTDLTYFKDSEGRYVNIRGINLGGNIKVPVVNGTQDNETPETYYGHIGDEIAASKAGEPLPFTYVGRPFSLEKAEAYFRQIKDLGFNSVRLLANWESVYPEKKGKPDREFLEYFDRLVELAGKYDIYVMINLHENVWSRTFYTLYSEWPVCQQCCNYDENNFAINPDGETTDIVCTDARKKECCPNGDLMNMLWSMFPQKTRTELGILPGDSPEVAAEKYRAGYSDRVSGDGAPLWASRICQPEKNFESPYWGVPKLLGAAKNETGDIMYMDLFNLIKTAAAVLANLEEPIITQEVADQVTAQLDRMEPYLPPAAFPSTDTWDGLPWKMWGINNGTSLSTNICFAMFWNGDDAFPKRRVVEYGYADKPDDGVDIEMFYTPEEAETRAAELRGQGYTHVKVNNTLEAMQGGYRDAWEEIAKIGKKYPHVIGYDIQNEPAAIYVLASVVAAYLDLGSPDLVKSLLDAVVLDDAGLPMTLPGGQTIGEVAQQILEDNLNLLPKDNSDETRKALGLYGVDLMTLIGMNMTPDKNALEPLYEYVGKGILDVYMEGDEPANRLTFWMEPANGLETLLGGSGGGVGGQYLQYATTPDIPGADEYAEQYGEIKYVWAPHKYPDIYPFLGFNMPERIFGDDEYDFRDYTDMIKPLMDWAVYAYDNIPAAMCEFGTYWNFRNLDNEEACAAELKECRALPDTFASPQCEPEKLNCKPGYKQSREREYLVSTQILDNYYETFEKMGNGNMIWVYTPDADPKYGDYWDHEDFSLVEFIQKANEPERFESIRAALPERYVVDVAEPEGIVAPRGYAAFVRPYAHLISGKPVSSHFYSDLHYFDPSKGELNAEHEYELVFESKETGAPTVIFVPELQYPDGFYVWLSDGYVVWQPEDQWLYYFPDRDEPGWQHKVTIRPPLAGQDSNDWDYFVRDGFVVAAD